MTPLTDLLGVVGGIEGLGGLGLSAVTTDWTRQAAAAVAVVLYLLASGAIVARHRRAHRRTAVTDATPAEKDISGERRWLVAYASQTGTAAELAAGAAEALRTAGLEAHCVDIAHVTSDVLGRARRLLFVASTTGEGDPPDHAEPFVRTVMAGPGGYPHLEYGILALGDRGYEQFCAFGRAIDGWLRNCAATPLFERIEVDGDDPLALDRWAACLAQIGARDASLTAAGPVFRDVRLVERRRLNAGSPGGPTYLVALDSTGCSWQAGDLAVIRVGGERDAGTVTREYSIASAPSCGRLELVVRQVRGRDGRLGVGSGLLTEHTAVGDVVSLRIREHASFRGPDGNVPLVLIGNGTGIAGLCGHLRERVSAGRDRNWLFFGERTRAHDFLFREDLEAWRASGFLQRLDATFSRDADDGRYVQDLIAPAADSLRAWVDEGAWILVCGSASGMAPGVETALAAALGAERLNSLRAKGRYRRDVY